MNRYYSIDLTPVQATTLLARADGVDGVSQIEAVAYCTAESQAIIHDGAIATLLLRLDRDIKDSTGDCHILRDAYTAVIKGYGKGPIN